MAARIFISYRRDDSAIFTGRLFDRLVAAYGPESIFVDIDSIRPGENFTEVVAREIKNCVVFIPVVGPRWETGSASHNRIENPGDYVRLEIEEGIRQKKVIIPVYFERKFPTKESLPPSLVDLAFKNGRLISVGRSFAADVYELRRELDQILFTSLAARALHKLRLFLRRYRNLLIFFAFVIGIVAALHNRVGRLLIDRSAIGDALADKDPLIFAKAESGLREPARAFGTRKELIQDTSLAEAIYAAKSSLDVFAINATSFFAQREALEAALRNGARIRFVLLDLSAGPEVVDQVYSLRSMPNQEKKGGKAEHISAVEAVSTLQMRCKMEPSVFKGSVEVRWWRGRFTNSMWIRDSALPGDMIGHMECFYQGDQRLNPAFRCGPASPYMVRCMQEQFNYIWEHASPQRANPSD